MATSVGVDGAGSGWLGVWRVAESLDSRWFGTAEQVLSEFPLATAIGVDIPIGLTESGPRLSDSQARKFVGRKRQSSIFSSPVRGILDAKTQPEASRRHREIDQRGFGVQSFGILPKIREWDVLLRSDARARRCVFEVHPEVSFSAIAGGEGCGVSESKKSAEGHRIRRELLAGYFGEAAVDKLLLGVASRFAARDDVLDALVALWSAERIAAGVAVSMPTPPPTDSAGLRMAIWY